MAPPPKLPNLVKFFTAIRKPQREHLNHLATVKGLTDTETVYELVSRGIAIFLARRPWETEPDFTWVKPESYYTMVGGKRYSNKDWVNFNCKIGDIASADGGMIRSRDLLKELDGLVHNVAIPWLRARGLLTHGKAQNTVYYTIICWMLDNLYPEAMYPRPIARPLAVYPAAVRRSARH